MSAADFARRFPAYMTLETARACLFASRLRRADYHYQRFQAHAAALRFNIEQRRIALYQRLERQAAAALVRRNELGR